MAKLPASKKEPVGDEWWDGYMPTHPMTDAQFCEAFCEHVLRTTDYISLRQVRARAHRFIRNFMAPELDKELTRYREFHE